MKVVDISVFIDMLLMRKGISLRTGCSGYCKIGITITEKYSGKLIRLLVRRMNKMRQSYCMKRLKS